MVIQNRNKGAFVARAVHGALSQTFPCEIIVSDQDSTDNSLAEIERAVREFGQHQHSIRVLRCPVSGPFSMTMCNAHFDWAWRQASPDCEWIFQCSSDDYSLPDRVKVCLEALESNPCSAIATTMYFENPGETNRESKSGYPLESVYVKAGEGIARLAYGSVIAGYSRSFMERAGGCGPNTMDVLYGYLAALDRGFYVVANPQHVHVQHADVGNAGFGGKLRGSSGDENLKISELNHYQLLRLYFACRDRALELHPEGIPDEAMGPLNGMIIGQAQGWLGVRNVLHARGITPGVM